MSQVALPARGTCGCQVGESFVVATSSGSVHVVDMLSGTVNLSSQNAIHTDYVTTIQPSKYSSRLVSCSRDGTVKVWSTSGQIFVTICNTKKMLCACFMNCEDDIAIGSSNQVEMVSQSVLKDYRHSTDGSISDCTVKGWCCEQELPSFAKRALNLGKKAPEDSESPCIGTASEMNPKWGIVEEAVISFAEYSALDRLFHPKDNKSQVTKLSKINFSELPVLSGKASVTHLNHQPACKCQPSTPSESTSCDEELTEEKSSGSLQQACCSQQTLAVTKRVLDEAFDPSESCGQRLDIALQPRLIPALKVVTDPQGFWEGSLVTPNVKKRKKRKIKKRRKKPLKHDLVHLEKKSLEDEQLFEAMKQLRVEEARFAQQLNQLIPNQSVLVRQTPSKAKI